MNGLIEWPPYCGTEVSVPTDSGRLEGSRIFAMRPERETLTCVMPANGHRWHRAGNGFEWFW